MRLALAVLVSLAVSAVFAPVKADPYTWCVIHSGKPASTECWFTSYEQCHATASGMGGFCIQNPRNATTEDRRGKKRL